MSCRTGQRGWKGSAGSYAAYIEDELGIDEGAESYLHYQQRPADGIVLNHVRGKATAHLHGLDLERGLTKGQFEDLFAGRWDEVQHLKHGYAPVWLTDDKGRLVYRANAETGKDERIPVINPETGKQLYEPVYIAGHDVTFSMDKTVCEYLIAHSEDIPLMQELMIQAVDIAMERAVEDYARVVRIPNKDLDKGANTQGTPAERAVSDGLVWAVSLGSAARPTPEAIERGYGADPHFHAHAFLFAMAAKDGRWRKTDGAALWRTADFRRDVFDIEFARLLEEHGFQLEWSKEPDRKGRRTYTIVGSHLKNREYFSTNGERANQIAEEYERVNSKPMTRRDLDHAMAITKAQKNEAAKIADKGGLAQWELWKTCGERDGLVFDMPARGQSRRLGPVEKRIAELHRRLEASEGLNRYCGQAAIFGPDAVLPATTRAGLGLGFSTDELATLAQAYTDNHLILVRDAREPSARYYTTKTIRANEQAIAKGLDKLAANYGPRVPGEVIKAIVGRQKVMPDPGQKELIKAVCGSSKLVNCIGVAGAGKGFAIDIATQALRETKDFNQIVVTATAAKRAAELGAQIGADRAGSVESLRRQYAKGWRPNHRTVIFVDESALIDSFDMADIVRIGGKAKIVLIGDELQAPAINAAGWLADECDKRTPLELTHVYRQPSKADQAMLSALRHGRSEVAVHMLYERNRIHVSETPEDLVAAIADRYASHREAGRKVTDVAIVHQGSYKELDMLSRAVQRWRIEHGEVDNTESFVVSESTTGRRWTLCKGDRVVFNEGVWMGRNTPIRNGQTGELISVNAQGRCRVRLDGSEKRTVAVYLQREAPRQTIGLEYAMVTSKYQGNQAKVVLAMPGDPNIASRNSGYSQLSRMIEHVEVFIDRQRWGARAMESLSVAWATAVNKISASSIIEREQRTRMSEGDQYTGRHRSSTFDEPDFDEAFDEWERETRTADAQRMIEQLRDTLDRGRDFGLTV